MTIVVVFFFFLLGMYKDFI